MSVFLKNASEVALKCLHKLIFLIAENQKSALITSYEEDEVQYNSKLDTI